MSTLLSNRTITTSKSIQIISNKSSNLFVNLLESRIFIRTAKYRKVTIELLTPVINLGEKGYMRNDLYPSRKANYYIPTAGKYNSLQSKGPSQIHQIAKGGQITLAILGRSYAVHDIEFHENNSGEIHRTGDFKCLFHFSEIQRKVPVKIVVKPSVGFQGTKNLSTDE
ncbi:9548_t:CDS:2 [Funneliformis geosporum]|uniref:9548_t:CDS:1 n=1 Tax=Funneliformis geosporum TaxID=1117311 RepID=A0A9W4STQ5_9GLOM|nr:9548_t:CDS:2 [Funneliformis geosporum]